MDIDGMEAGREMDIPVHEKVMNKTVYRCGGNYPHDGDCKGDDCKVIFYSKLIPHYSTDIVAAMTVAEELGLPFSLHRSYRRKWGEGPLGWRTNWCKDENCPCKSGEGCPQSNEVWAETAPLAICRGALKMIKPMQKMETLPKTIGEAVKAERERVARIMMNNHRCARNFCHITEVMCAYRPREANPYDYLGGCINCWIERFEKGEA